jgi:hypothetical protein
VTRTTVHGGTAKQVATMSTHKLADSQGFLFDLLYSFSKSLRVEICDSVVDLYGKIHDKTIQPMLILSALKTTTLRASERRLP